MNLFIVGAIRLKVKSDKNPFGRTNKEKAKDDEIDRRAGLYQGEWKWGYGSVSAHNMSDPFKFEYDASWSLHELKYCLPMPSKQVRAGWMSEDYKKQCNSPGGCTVKEDVCVSYKVGRMPIKEPRPHLWVEQGGQWKINHTEEMERAPLYLKHRNDRDPITWDCPDGHIGSYYERPILAAKRCGRIKDCVGIAMTGDMTVATSKMWSSGEYLKHVTLLRDPRCLPTKSQLPVMFFAKQKGSNLEKINDVAVYNSFILAQGGDGCYAAIANNGFERGLWSLNNFMDGISASSGATFNTLSWYQKEHVNDTSHGADYRWSAAYTEMYGDAVYDPWWNTYGPSGEMANFRFAQFCSTRMWLLSKDEFIKKFGSYESFLLSCMGCKGKTYYECNDVDRSLQEKREVFGNMYPCVEKPENIMKSLAPAIQDQWRGLAVYPYKDGAWHKAWSHYVKTDFFDPLNISENESVLNRSSRIGDKSWTYSMSSYKWRTQRDFIDFRRSKNPDLMKDWGVHTEKIDSTDIFLNSQGVVVDQEDAGGELPQRYKRGGLLDIVSKATDSRGQQLIHTAWIFATGACDLNMDTLIPEIETQNGGSAFLDKIHMSTEAGLLEAVQTYFSHSVKGEGGLEAMLPLLYAMNTMASKLDIPFGQKFFEYAYKILGKDHDRNVETDTGFIDTPPIMATLRQLDFQKPFDRSEQIVMQLTGDELKSFLKYFKSKELLLNQVVAGRQFESLKKVLQCKEPMTLDAPNIFKVFELKQNLMHKFKEDSKAAKASKDGEPPKPIPGETQFSETQSLQVVHEGLDSGLLWVEVDVLPNRFFQIRGGYKLKLVVSALHATQADWEILSYLPESYQTELKKNGFPKSNSGMIDDRNTLGLPWVEAFVLTQTASSRIMKHMCTIVHSDGDGSTCSMEMEKGGSFMPLIGKSNITTLFHPEPVHDLTWGDLGRYWDSHYR